MRRLGGVSRALSTDHACAALQEQRCLQTADGAEAMKSTERRDLAFFGWLFGVILLAVFWWSGKLDPVFKWIDKLG